MASPFTLHSAKTAALLGGASSLKNRPLIPHQNSISFGSTSRSGPALLHQLQGGLKVLAQSSEVAAVEKTANSKPVPEEKTEEEIPKADKAVLDVSLISDFMSQAAHLVELVDSKDIVELQLKQQDFEISIRKKEALPQQQQVLSPPPVVWQQPAVQHAFAQTQDTQVQQPPAATAAAPLALPPPSKPKKSSHPPLKSPVPGTFYRAPAPGQPPFVKVGDKVKKGQILCIVEAMKLMNEIEAEYSGTVVEILVENGKPICLGEPLFIIEP
ncbi:unnamed protein product [Cuscuta campestris]|uniref:Biotin carboxyl carrier protein of acetyl-CoA carboxylase n=1 Tax=Cuscuta campestris TaxID=132261 RepID=A0A484MEX2_9ASTE|nr:unnamed protein product [Cuscuta campestris]